MVEKEEFSNLQQRELKWRVTSQIIVPLKCNRENKKIKTLLNITKIKMILKMKDSRFIHKEVKDK